MEIRPKAPVRRFDVFAEYTRLEKQNEGMPSDVAKGYAIWLAKIVAARKFGRIKPQEITGLPRGAKVAREKPRKFRLLGGKEQNDRTFDKEIVDRMGRDFYEKVFAPEIKRAFDRGKTYKQIRDSIRKNWKP